MAAGLKRGGRQPARDERLVACVVSFIYSSLRFSFSVFVWIVVIAVCVESTGAVPARELVFMAIDRLIEKCTKVQEAYSQAKAQENGGMLDAADVAKAAIAAMTTEPDDLSAR